MADANENKISTHSGETLVLATVLAVTSLAAAAFAQAQSPLTSQGYIDLPAHSKPGGFDHADVHRQREEYSLPTLRTTLWISSME